MVEHPAAKALTDYLLVRGGVHRVAYARAIENLTGAALTKMFPIPRIETAKIPECQPHIQRGDHKRLYRFSPDDYRELTAVFNGVHAETGDELEVVDGPPEGAAPNDLPPQPKAFVPGPPSRGDRRDRDEAPHAAGLPKEASGEINVPASGPGVWSTRLRTRSDSRRLNR
jgi:Mn-containing catalase